MKRFSDLVFLPALAIVWACGGSDHPLGTGSTSSRTGDAGDHTTSTGGAVTGAGGSEPSPSAGGSGGSPSSNGSGGVHSSGGSEPSSGGSTRGTDAGATGAACADLETQARTLVTDNQSCNDDADCQILIDGVGECLSAFACVHAFNTDVALESLKTAASDIVSAYEAAGCPCSAAACSFPQSAVCNSGLCEVAGASCQQPYYDEWQEIVDRYNSCDDDTDCGHVFVSGADCVAGCGPILNIGLDVSEIHEAGPRIADELVAACGVCVVPGCLAPAGFICNGESKCEAVY